MCMSRTPCPGQPWVPRGRWMPFGRRAGRDLQQAISIHRCFPSFAIYCFRCVQQMVSNKAGRSKHRTATTQGHVDSHCFWRICLAEQRAAKISGVAPGQFWNLETARFSTTDARTHLQSLTSRLVTRQPASQNLCSSISGSPPVDRQHRRSSMSHRRSSMPDPRCSICEGPRPSLDSNPAALRIADSNPATLRIAILIMSTCFCCIYDCTIKGCTFGQTS